MHLKVVGEEELLKADSKGDTQEAELLILDEFAVLCRDLYAFYPMLIRYVDNNRYWKRKICIYFQNELEDIDLVSIGLLRLRCEYFLYYLSFITQIFFKLMS